MEWNRYTPLIPLYRRPNVAAASDSVANLPPGAAATAAFNSLDMWNIADHGMKILGIVLSGRSTGP